MHPIDLIPVPDAVPVAWGWFQVLLTVTFVLHVIFMNFMLGGAVIALVATLRGGTRPDIAGWLGGKLPFSVAFAVNAGVAPLLFVQVLYGHFVYSSSILMAAAWFAIIPLLIVAYYALYAFRGRTAPGARTLLIGSATLILLFIGFLFTNNWTLSVTPEKWGAYFTHAGGTFWNLDEPTLWPRYLHMVVGAVAVAGLGMAAFGRVREGRTGDGGGLVGHGMAWFKWATLGQLALGLWWLLVLRSDVMKLFMGGNPVATAAFGAGFLLAVGALLTGFLQKVWPSVGLTAGTLLAMAVMREYVRYGYVRAHFTPDQLRVDPQVSSLVLFLATFAVGIGCIWYMLRLAAHAGKEV
ncbi:hypothetical protein KDM41_01975 [bacterium]|nr:hypothetical protein [bacterium]